MGLVQISIVHLTRNWFWKVMLRGIRSLLVNKQAPVTRRKQREEEHTQTANNISLIITYLPGIRCSGNYQDLEDCSLPPGLGYDRGILCKDNKPPFIDSVSSKYYVLIIRIQQNSVTSFLMCMVLTFGYLHFNTISQNHANFL